MLGEMLRAEIERRWAVLLAVMAGFAAIPLTYWWRLGRGAPLSPPEFGARLQETEMITFVLCMALPLLAYAWGAGTWTPERRGGWEYTLSLPLPRVKLFALRYVAALAWLALPAALLWALSWGVAAAVPRPAGVYAYPAAFAAWATLVLWLGHSAGFVMASRLRRHYLWVAVPGAFILFLLLAAVAMGGVLSVGVEDEGVLRPLTDYQPPIGY